VISLLLAAIVGITLHEAAHAGSALLMGDPTAHALGRASLAPWRHIDPLGSLAVPLVLFTLTGVVAGWGRAVPLDRTRLGRLGYLLAVAAGPAANALLAFGCWLAGWDAGATANLALCCLNLLPVPPLDGSHIARELLWTPPLRH
jgi:Zn-dependent protease